MVYILGFSFDQLTRAPFRHFKYMYRTSIAAPGLLSELGHFFRDVDNFSSSSKNCIATRVERTGLHGLRSIRWPPVSI